MDDRVTSSPGSVASLLMTNDLVIKVSTHNQIVGILFSKNMHEAASYPTYVSGRYTFFSGTSHTAKLSTRDG